MDVPVADVQHDRAEPEEHRKQQRENDDYLAALAYRRAGDAATHVHGTSPVMSPTPWVGS